MGCSCSSNFKGGTNSNVFSMHGAKKRMVEHNKRFSSFVGKKGRKHSNFVKTKG